MPLRAPARGEYFIVPEGVVQTNRVLQLAGLIPRMYSFQASFVRGVPSARKTARGCL